MDFWQIWILIGIFLFILEIFTPGFILACIGISCIVTGLVCLTGVGLIIQLIAFSVANLVIFCGIRPLFLKFLYPAGTGLTTNVEALVGKNGLVLERLDPVLHSGRVKVGGEDWRGMPVDDLPIEAGELVTVVRVEGTRLYVKRIEI